LKQAEHDDIDRVFTLFYSNRQEKDAAFDTEMEQLKLKHFTYITTLSQETTPCNEPNRERGYICEPMLEKYLARDTVKENWYYLVGAPAFIEAMEKALVSMGISKERFVIDPFTGLLSANQAGK
jgi:ferredoxin-NADP reductase